MHTVTEEFTASWFGWPVRTIEAAVKPGSLGFKWAYFAYGTWLGLSAPRREGHEQDRPRAVLLQRECDRNQGVSRDPRNARFLTWASVKWIVRNRAWSWWYLVRYWRFLWLKVRHRHIITEGSSSSVGIANCMPARGTAS